MYDDYTVVLGVDRKHLAQLNLVLPTWKKHKPDLFKHKFVIFYDREQVTHHEVWDVLDSHLSFYTTKISLVPWSEVGVVYPGDPSNKWTCPQRYKMLAGFVYVPAWYVNTRYWLKLDLDTVATRHDGGWVDQEWFEGNPAIISHPWGFTKPADQMIQLDRWAEEHSVFDDEVSPPLNLKPKDGWSRLRHKRIISWCAFFNTEFTKVCAAHAIATCDKGMLPVRSQDGYHWYMAKRMGHSVICTNMKNLGWKHCSSTSSVRKEVEKSLEGFN